MTENIAEAVRHRGRPEGKVAGMEDLGGQARRLERALAVAEKWVEAACEDGEMLRRAEHARDQIEEELSRVAFAMEVEACKVQWGEDLGETAEASALDDALLSAYCVLRDAPSHLFGDRRPRTRHELMGALMVAMDAIGGKREPKNA
jgi:hypothetical protein